MSGFKSHLMAAACGLAALALSSTAASASLVVGNYSALSGDVVNGKPCGGSAGASGTTISGCISGTPSQVVNFSTTDGKIKFASGSAAVVEGIGTTNKKVDLISNLTISLANATFDQISFDLVTSVWDLGFFDSAKVVFSANGETATEWLDYGNSNNAFTITGQDLTSLTMTTYFYGWVWFVPVTVEDPYIYKVKDTTIGGIDNGQHNLPPSVPEPLSLSLFGAALAGLAAARRRKAR